MNHEHWKCSLKKYLVGLTPAKVGIFVASRFAIWLQVCLVENWISFTLISFTNVSIRDLLGTAFFETSSCRKWTNVLVTDVFLSTLSRHICSRVEACASTSDWSIGAETWSSDMFEFLLSKSRPCELYWDFTIPPFVREKCCLRLSRTQRTMWLNFLPQRRENLLFVVKPACVFGSLTTERVIVLFRCFSTEVGEIAPSVLVINVACRGLPLVIWPQVQKDQDFP